ncbi:flagellin N-terminal helical domain-containing protein [Poseidonibacter ostreae]|jgi:flagellin|uniref:Flagellin n=1 Tax=Poseidonibacter ostreae TaxID=2654171 RepID=A0A6L4WSB6_9BACT|nr:flagellin [Poseidonibacter ostreae]KAB7885797.1 flagellin [Poseidonibacter ostreae]KAB7886966.1 flagellin [Poseidonibacter ostreae]KAB7887222.1 flagellin [Poseidonibacter ostreae]
MQVGNNSQINTDVYLNANQSLNKIATGVTLNQASNDASSLAISNNLKVEANGYTQAIENTNSAIALNQIADGATKEQSNILDSVKEKLLQASTDTTSQEGRDAILKDVKSLLEQFDNIASSTNYNGNTLLQNSQTDNSASNDLQFQAGNENADIIESAGIQSNTEGLGLSALLNQDASSFSSSDARAFLEDVDGAISGLSDIRSEFGSVSNQLESSTRNLITQQNQTLEANSVFDTDYAKESANFSKQNVLAQIGAFSLAQANNINQQTVGRLLS